MDKRTARWNALVTALIFVEGGGRGRDLRSRCAEGFRRLFESCGLVGRFRIVACGGRTATYDRFMTAHSNNPRSDYIAMLVDSEEPVENVEAPWNHLAREQWQKPDGADHNQVLLMTTCMETWIVCDRQALVRHYGGCLQESALPSLQDLEGRHRADVQYALTHATRNCTNAYAKGKNSFQVLGRLSPDAIEPHLPSFARARRILSQKL